jgi:hypothetical protein
LRRALNEEAAAPPLALLAVPQKSFLRIFLIWRAISFSSKRKRNIFFWVLLSTSWTAGITLLATDEAEFPHTPFRHALALEKFAPTTKNEDMKLSLK